MIVVVGSLNVDLVVPVERFPAAGETLLGADYARHRGGKGANQAVAAARAGGRVRMVGRVGDDAFGAWLRDGLESDGIDHHGVVALADVPTGVAFISVDARAQNTIIVSPGANGRLSGEDLAAVAFEGADVALLQLEVPLDATLRAAELAKAAGAIVILNLAPATALDAAQLRHVDVLVVNESEAALLLEADPATIANGPERAARALTERVPTAIVTLGAAGATWARRATAGAEPAAGHVPGYPVTAVDTTAAGDSFVGALAAALDGGAPIERALSFANAAGALAVTVPGAQPSLPTADAIEALVAEAEA
ncbi:MAG: ribokinase [Trueperaceae bacterium]